MGDRATPVQRQNLAKSNERLARVGGPPSRPLQIRKDQVHIYATGDHNRVIISP
jgi:hypothetical protein